MEKHDAVLDSDGRCQMSYWPTGDRQVVCGQLADGDNHVRYPVIGSGAVATCGDPTHDHTTSSCLGPRFTDDAETHGTEPEDMVEAVTSDQDEEVGMFPDGTVVGDKPLPGIDMGAKIAWPSNMTPQDMAAQMAFPLQALSTEAVLVALGVDIDGWRAEGARIQLEAAARRATDYMRSARVPEPAIQGVVKAITLEIAKPAAPLDPWPTRRTEMPKEWAVVCGLEVAGPMTEAEAWGLRSKLMQNPNKYSGELRVRRMIHPADL